MTNFDVIANRIVAAEAVSFAIACQSGHGSLELTKTREALKRAIVEALENVHMDTVNAMAPPIHVYPDRAGKDIVSEPE